MVLASGHATVWGCAHCRCFLRPCAGGGLGSRHSAGSLLLTSGCGERGQKRKEQVTECPSPYLCLMLFTLWLSVCSPGNSYKKKKSSEAAWSQVKQQLEVSAEGPLNKRFIRTDISHMLFFFLFFFFAPKSTLQRCPRQALGPKMVKCQKTEKKKKKIALTDHDHQGTCISR